MSDLIFAGPGLPCKICRNLLSFATETRRVFFSAGGILVALKEGPLQKILPFPKPSCNSLNLPGVLISRSKSNRGGFFFPANILSTCNCHLGGNSPLFVLLDSKLTKVNGKSNLALIHPTRVQPRAKTGY